MAENPSSGPAPARWEQVDLLSLVTETAGEAEPAALVDPDPRLEPADPDPEVVVCDPDPPADPGSPPVPPAPARAQPAPDPCPAEAVLPEPSSAPGRLLILDTETTGLDPDRHQCIEVGAILFDVPSRAVLSQLSFLLPCDRNPAEAVNGIAAAVSRLDQPVEAALTLFEQLVAGADAVLAHNAAFDRQWFGRGGLPVIDRPWICSMEDIRWPPERRLKSTPSVRDLALAYGVPVWAAHRALTDCIYLAQVFERCSDLDRLLQEAIEPRRLYRAVVAYDERHLAKAAGFRWNQPLAGAWSRRLSVREASDLTFAVIPVDAEASGVA